MTQDPKQGVVAGRLSRKNKMINQLIKLTDCLDSYGFYKEADYLDGIIKKIAEGNEEAQPWSVTEIVDIGNGYSQVKFNSTQGAVDEQYIFERADLPDLTPGEGISDDAISSLTSSEILKGEGFYQDPDSFFKEKGIEMPLKKGSDQGDEVPAGAMLIMSVSSGGKTTCYYRVGEDKYYDKEGDLSYDCTGGGKIDDMSLRESQW